MMLAELLVAVVIVAFLFSRGWDRALFDGIIGTVDWLRNVPFGWWR